LVTDTFKQSKGGRAETAEEDSAQRRTQQEIRAQQRRQRRLERYEKVAEMHSAGYSQSAIADTLGIDRRTVRRWTRHGKFPERKKPVPRRLQVEEHAEYVRYRWDQGCRNATTLFHEIRQRGYRGGRSMVAQYVRAWRKTGALSKGPVQTQVTPRQAALLACKSDQTLAQEQRALLDKVIANCPELGVIRALAQDFRNAILGGDSALIEEWIRNAQQSGIRPLVRFAWGLNRDLAAVEAAVETSYSNGQVEGQVNRLKTIKRQMYGRAGFSLLRARVLPLRRAAPP
jgi:transposase